MDTVCGDLQLAARNYMEVLSWNNNKRKGGGNMLDLFIRACFIRGLHDDRIKTMVKAKGNVNTPMAQLVEVALEEESVIRSERFKRNFPEKGQQTKGTGMSQKHFERREVRVITVTCYRCKKAGHIARNCKELPRNHRDEQNARGPANSRNRSGNEQRTANRSKRRYASKQEVANTKTTRIWTS
jgi:hypothetical protein